MDITDRLKQSLLEELREDHVGLWSIVRDVRYALPKATDREIKDQVVSLIDKLLSTSLVKAGFPMSDGIGFKPWRLPRHRIVQRIKTEWDRLGRDPDIGEVAWFSADRSAKIGTDSESSSRR